MWHRIRATNPYHSSKNRAFIAHPSTCAILFVREVVHQDRVIESEVGDDLCNLCFRVGSRIPSERDQFVDEPELNALRHRLNVSMSDFGGYPT
jgi:hypothetical protein